MDQINIIKNLKKSNKNIAKVLTILILCGLINPKFKYLHWKLIKQVGLSVYLDNWVYALMTAEVPELAVVGLCRKALNEKANA